MNASYTIGRQQYDASDKEEGIEQSEEDILFKYPNALIIVRSSKGFRGFDSVEEYKMWLLNNNNNKTGE